MDTRSMHGHAGRLLCLVLAGLTFATSSAPPPASAEDVDRPVALQQENRSFYICRPVRYPTPHCDPGQQYILVGRTDRIRVEGLEGRGGSRVSIYRRSNKRPSFELWKRPVVRNGAAVVSWAPRREDTFVFMARIRQGGQLVETNYLSVSAELHFT